MSAIAETFDQKASPQASNTFFTSWVFTGEAGNRVHYPEVKQERRTAGNLAACVGDDSLERTFGKLVIQWKEETRRLSVIAHRYQNPAYQAILKLPKPEVIVLILKELRRDPDRWFAALKELTDEDASKTATTFYEAVDMWVAWGISEGHID